MPEQRASPFRLNIVSWMIVAGFILSTLTMASIDMDAIQRGSPSFRDVFMLVDTVVALLGVVVGLVFWWREWKRLKNQPPGHDSDV